MNDSVIPHKAKGSLKTQEGHGLDTHNKEAILRRKKINSTLSGENQNVPLSTQLALPHALPCHAAQLPAGTAQLQRAWAAQRHKGLVTPLVTEHP